MNESDIEIPSSESDITPSWVSKVTGHVVLSDNFRIESNVQEGDGFLSSVYRVAYTTKEGETHQIIIKLLPDNPKWLEFALADATDEREIKVYTIALPDFVKMVPELKENICQVYHGIVKPEDPSTGRKKASMIIMNDLKHEGFRMMDFAGEELDSRIQSLITFQVRLHFGALAVELEKGKPLSELYPFMQGVENASEWIDQIEYLCEEGFRLLEKLLADFKMPPNIWEEYKKLKPYARVITEKIVEAGRINPCFIHGDVWPTNIQVHETRPVTVLDWQLVGYRDPTYDLSVMLYTVLPREKLTMENIRRFLRQYHDEFEKLCVERGYQDKIKRRSYEEFEKFFFTWGVSFIAFLMIPSIECYGKNLGKYCNIFRFFYEENHITKFLLQQCT